MPVIAVLLSHVSDFVNVTLLPYILILTHLLFSLFSYIPIANSHCHFKFVIQLNRPYCCVYTFQQLLTY